MQTNHLSPEAKELLGRLLVKPRAVQVYGAEEARAAQELVAAGLAAEVRWSTYAATAAAKAVR